ncbi:glycosyltransferase family 4 protein [Coraliomargarita parva]|uniref:glycosyltransferase family 4 protein n=1 Tax=Coraliomargarita parva TaxID=3014050 RepID=UPI0022B3FBC4|nr:glycosyltransferase family 4 protein [Coraliomargarita parva]
MAAEKKRIAILADFPWSFLSEGAKGRGGGQGNPWLMQLAEELCQYTDEYEFHWVTLDLKARQSGPETEVWEGQHFYRLPRTKITVDLLLGYWPSRRRLLAALREIQPDLVHCWGTERPFPVVFNHIKVPGILSMQGVMSTYKEIGAIPPGFQWKIITSFEPKFIRSADVVTAESKWGMEQVRKIRPDAKLYQVEYGVNRGFYDVHYCPDNESPYALFVGTFDRRKGIDLLVEAMASIDGRGWKLRVAGDGPLRAQLQANSPGNVEWLGMLDWKALQAQLAGARCLVLPTKADTSPNVVKEARVIGLPVVTTRHGGQAEYVIDGVNGYIVDPLEQSGLVEALCRVMDDPEHALSLGGRNHEKDRDYFQPANTARGFISIYRELLGSLRCL